MCHECGEYFASVSGHIYRAHGLRAKAYKDKHGLPRGTALIAPELARRQSENTRRRLGSDDWKKFEKARDPEKAAHARSGEDYRRRGVARDNARESGTQRIQGKRKRVHDGVCRVCGEPRGAGRSPFMTCARPVCEQILRYRNWNGADGRCWGGLIGRRLVVRRGGWLRRVRGCLSRALGSGCWHCGGISCG
ncbi:MucR family transcriptional regulator [Corynebacterium macclintockiae]|uniref:MucR family transcriptional regulator n=1 Tax=Corynebacterium macclintockiae TaxID=2913501 RepID=UPI003EB776B0